MQWNKIEIPEIASHKYSQILSLTKEQRLLNEERVVFSTNDAETIGYLYAKKKKKKNLNTGLTFFTK